MVLWAYNTSQCSGVEIREFLGLAAPRLAESVSYSSPERTFLKNKVESDQGKHSVSISGLHTHRETHRKMLRSVFIEAIKQKHCKSQNTRKSVVKQLLLEMVT